jgi:hypothetical protein
MNPPSVEPAALLATSGGAVFTVVLIMAGGAYLSIRGFLSAETIKAVNKANMQLALPCMLFGYVSESASVEAWTVCWVLPFSAALNISMAFGTSTLFARLLRLPPRRARVFRMAATFGNSQAFPMVVLALIAEDFLKADAGAGRRATAYVAYYLVCWSIVCWSFGWSFISAPLPASDDDDVADRGGAAGALEAAPATGPCKAVGASGGAPSACARTGGPGGGEAEMTVARVDGCVGEGGDDDGGGDDGLLQTQRSWGGGGRWLGLRRGCELARAVLGSPALSAPVVAVLCGLLVGMTPPLKSLVVGESAPLHLVHRAMLLVGDSVVPVSTLLSGASLVTPVAPTAAQCRPRSRASRLGAALCRADYAGVVFVRLVWMPSVHLLLFLAARRYLGLFGRGPDGGVAGAAADPLIGFVVLLEGCMPTANNVVMMVTVAHDAELSRLAASLMAAQFVILPCMLVGWIAIFLTVVYG